MGQILIDNFKSTAIIDDSLIAQRLHTDGARKKNTAPDQAYLDSKGINATQTVPNASQSNSFAESQFRQLMAVARTAIAAAPHIPKDLWSFAVLAAADKGNYMAKSKNTVIKQSPNSYTKNALSPATLPWGRKRKIISAVKFKKTLEARVQDACYIRRKDRDLYQIWLPERNKVTKARIINDFIVHQEPQVEIGDTCENKSQM
eukprot:Plantae.Rhodophyta-Palmaria_palmata.ctg20410.p1 GENE.Plantae.Rhodophyta-Palmaria_palmata.ctg20410~~Plantae.Rhodophyta-Palmaria_palmata.ctg20410.p1  ORF type:complete len:203 (-),score=7.17 Plantae.Rhodophyta-Palmaria_palmata.ctg20410:21-629(-)